MKITKIYIKNFRSIEEIEICPKSFMCLVGENNTGKSNILKAIEFVLGERYPTTITKENIYSNNEDLEVRIDIYFDLTREEKEEVQKYRGQYTAGNIIGIRFHKKSKEQEQQSSVESQSDRYRLRLLTDSQIPKNKEEYIKTEIKQILGITYVEANRDIRRHLGYSSPYTFMSKLANKFEQELDRMQAEAEASDSKGLKAEIQETFKKVEDQFKQVEKFKNFDDSLQVYFEEHLPESASEKHYDISVNFRAYNPIHYFKSLSLIPKDGGKEIDLDQLGDGLKTILLLSYFKAYAEAFKNSSILMIEEPEIYLHPQLRRHIFDMFQDLSKAGVQVFFTTHSPDFLDVSNFENITIVKKNDGKTLVQQAVCKDINAGTGNDLLTYIKQYMVNQGIQDTPTKESVQERLRLFFRLEQNEAFFAKKVVLAEGETEFFALPIFANAMGYSLNKEGVTIVNCGTKYQIACFYYLLNKCFKIPTYVIFDGDSAEVTSGGQSSGLNIALQKMLEIASPTNTFSQNLITSNYAIFHEDFEDFIKSQFDDQAYLENLKTEARQIYGGKGEAKWFIQKFIATKITEQSVDEVTGEVRKSYFDLHFGQASSIIKKIIGLFEETPLEEEPPVVAEPIQYESEIRPEDLPF